MPSLRSPRAAGLFCLSFLTIAGCKSSAPATENAAPQTAAVARVQRGTISHTLTLAGQFQPFQVVDVHAKVSGYVRRIYVDIGDRVHAGQTLAMLEVPELNAQYRATQSEQLRARDGITQVQHQVGRAQAKHAALQANFDRLQQASAAQPGLIAEQELDDARSKAMASAAQIDAAKAALSAAREGADTAQADSERVGALQNYTTVTAPLNGVIVWRYADTGSLIQAGTASDTQSLPLVKLSQSDLLRLRMPVPEDAVAYVHEGDTVTLRVDALHRSIDAKIVRFTRNLSDTTRTMETEVDVPNKDLSITPGMYANASLQLAHSDNALTLPLGAVQGDGATGKVMVLDSENRLQPRTVKLGLRGSLLVEVKSGLQAGDRVLLGDQSDFQAGQQVTPRIQTEPAGDTRQEAGGVTDAGAPAEQAGS